MNESKKSDIEFAARLLEARDLMIGHTDDLVLERFKNTPWREITRHPRPVPRNDAGFLWAALLACAILLGIITCALVIKIDERTQSPSVRAVQPYGVAGLDPIIPRGDSGGRTIFINNTPIIKQFVELEGEERCDALRWVENGITKTKYVCEVRS